ncbi:MAG TPA: trigger factor [Burkholderiaceae bacterium]|nr:trigger factor [Burkholderiaceae bacterium]
MTTQLEQLGALERRLSMAVPGTEVNSRVQQRLREIARNAKLPGFRPGKVPMRMIEQSYGAQVQSEVIGDAVSKAFSDAVSEHKLRVAGQPQIEPKVVEGSNDLGFTATFEVYPDVSLGDVAALAIERPVTEVADADVERTLEVLRKQRVTWNEVQREAADGDRVTIDFVGTLDDVAFQGGTANDFPFVLGEGRMLADFETGVRGGKPGDQRTFPVAFPEDYGSKELAGKTASFAVTIKKVEAPELPALDADFARQLGVADGDVEKMKTDVRANLQREVTQRLRARTKNAVMDALAGVAELELPKALIQAESEALAERTKADMQARGMDVKNMPIPLEAFTDQATRRVRLGLIVSELVKQHGLTAKPDQIRKQIEEFAQSYENPGEVIRYYFSDRNRLAEVEAMVVEQNVVDWALDKARVTDKPLGFEELMSSN